MQRSATTPRIALIHALALSQPPVTAAFAALWPEAETFNLLDDSLVPDLAATGQVDATMEDRFLALGRYAAQSGAGGRATAGILFTCSAFGPAIERVQKTLPIPVLKPNEAAFEQAMGLGGPIGMVVTFASALAPMVAEFHALARSLGVQVRLEAKVAEGALQALHEGHPEHHDELIAETARGLGGVKAIVLGQFSMARAAAVVSARTGRKVLTTPEAAVIKLRGLIAGPDLGGPDRRRETSVR